MTLADTTLIPRLRRMTAEPTTTTYSDATLEAIITAYPVVDSAHLEPDETGWVPTYDLHAAAQDIWEEKAAAVNAQHDFSADSSSFSVSQIYEHCMNQARWHGARRRAQSKKSTKMPQEPHHLTRHAPVDTLTSGPYPFDEQDLYTGEILPEDLP